MTLKIIPVGAVTAEKGHRIEEKTLNDVAKKINHLSEAGSASWSLNYSIPVIQNNRIENFIITLSLTMKMPVWANYTNRPEKEKKEWDRFYKALRYHEDQHHELCRRLARMMNQKLLNEKNEKDFKRVFNAGFSKFQTLNDKLDEDSGHGTKQDSPFGTTVIHLY